MMVEYTTAIKKFEQNGDKTGWSYIEVPADIAEAINPGIKKSFKVKGKLDDFKFKAKSLLPMGGGMFILPLDATVRKNIYKKYGAILKVQLALDNTPFIVPAWILACLEDEPEAKERFFNLPMGHQNYFIKWVESAKTDDTRTKRIARVVTAFIRGWDFGEMVRRGRDDKMF